MKRSNLLLQKYKPKTLKNIIGHVELKEVFNNYIKEKEIPNMIISGEWGVGKSAIVECLLRDFYGDSFKNNTISINCSQKENRSIQAMDDLNSNSLRYAPSDGFKFKVIIFEESEQITLDGMRALKGITESTSEHNRFIFITNYYETLITKEPGLLSRFLPVKMKNVSSDLIKDMLYMISEREKKLNDHVKNQIENILSLSDTTPRTAIKNLDLVFSGGNINNMNSLNEKVNKLVLKLFNVLKGKKPISVGKHFQSILESYDTIKTNDVSERMLLKVLFDNIKTYIDKYPSSIGKISLVIAKCDINLQGSNNSELHMYSLLYKICVEIRELHLKVVKQRLKKESK